MKNKVKKSGASSLLGLRVLCVIFCVIFIAVIACSSFAYFELERLKKRAEGFGGEADKIRIYIDQGHNPAPHHNSGAAGNGLSEQDLTFEIGTLLAELLTDDGRYEVCLSRPDGSTVLGTDNASSLKARVDGAAAFEADYFISLHINSHTGDAANGIEVFVSGKDYESYLLSGYLLRGALDCTGLNDRGVKRGEELYVLKNAEMPAALVEMGFISNARDAALLAEQPELFAEGIYKGITEHFDFLYNLNTGAVLIAIGASAALFAASAAAFCTLTVRSFKMKSKNSKRGV